MFKRRSEMAKNNRKDRDDDTADVYFIPPNYVDSSGVFGGMFRLRNAIEACAVGGVSAWLLFGVTAGMGLTVRVTILLAGVLPLMFFAAIGVMGLSITEFLYFCFRFLFKRRIIGNLSPKKNKKGMLVRGKRGKLIRTTNVMSFWVGIRQVSQKESSLHKSSVGVIISPNPIICSNGRRLFTSISFNRGHPCIACG